MTQAEMILDYMHQYGSITPLEALKHIGCMRLAARISDLKRRGEKITGEREYVINKFHKKVYYKRYMLEDDHEEE